MGGAHFFVNITKRLTLGPNTEWRKSGKTMRNLRGPDMTGSEHAESPDEASSSGEGAPRWIVKYNLHDFCLHLPGRVFARPGPLLWLG